MNRSFWRCSLPRPVSWLPRLHEISRAVENSVRSHYTRRDLEDLFGLQPRAAQKLLEILPTLAVGTSRLVERASLAEFLDRVKETEDVSGLTDALRHQRIAPVRRKLRSLVQTDRAPVSVCQAPEGVVIRPGHLEVRFQTVTELAQAMYFIARLLEGDGESFAETFEPHRSLPRPFLPAVQELFAELEAMESAPQSAA